MALGVLSTEYQTGQSAKLPRALVDGDVFSVPCTPEPPFVEGGGQVTGIAHDLLDAVGLEGPLWHVGLLLYIEVVKAQQLIGGELSLFGIVLVEFPVTTAVAGFATFEISQISFIVGIGLPGGVGLPRIVVIEL